MNFSVTTVMIPHLDLAQTCALLADTGYDGIELRVRPWDGEPDAEPAIWGRHETGVSPDNVLERADEIRAVTAEHGLAIAAFGASCTATELDEIRKLAAGAAAVGCPLVKVGLPQGYDGSVHYQELYDGAVRAFEAAIPILREHGVRALVETHGGTIVVSASLMHRLVSNFDVADIGVIYDTNNMVMDGFETIGVGLDLLGGYVAHAHVAGRAFVPGAADANGTVTWDMPYCALAEGRFNHGQLLAQLHERGFEGFISLEDFDDSRTAEDKLADAIPYLHRIDPSR